MKPARWLARDGLRLIAALAAMPTARAQIAVPVITQQPVSRTVTEGTPVTFSVTATGGTPTLAYQWRKGGTNISGATNSSLTIALPLVADSANYSVAVSNSAGFVTSNNAILTVNPGPRIDGPGGVAVGQPATISFPSSGNQQLTFQWFKGNPEAPALTLIPGATAAQYVIRSATRADAGTYYVRVTDGSGVPVLSEGEVLQVFPAPQTLTFNAPSNAVVSPAPVSLGATASSGLPVTYFVVSGPATASGGNVTLTAVGNVTIRASQPGNDDFVSVSLERSFAVGKGTPVISWANPNPVADGTAISATQLNAMANVPGNYAYNPGIGFVVRAPSQTLNLTFTPNDTTNYNNATAQRVLTVNPPAPADPARLTNVSVRTTLPAAQTLIVGFTMQGGEKQVLLRAVGPGLAQFNVPGVMADPRLTLFRQTTMLEANDNWGGGAALMMAFARVGAFGLATSSLDAAILRSIDGGHTAQITGPTGTVLVEVYDSGSGSSPRLTNVSARNRVGTGADILIAGFTIGGTGQRNLLIRGVGPSLAALGVPVASTLFDPRIAIFSTGNTNTPMATNDNWSTALTATFASVGAFPLTAGSRDAALTLALGPGGYTVQVSGADGGSGEAVVELYELP